MGATEKSRYPLRPSATVTQPDPTEAQIRIEALHIARNLSDAHDTQAVLKNANAIRAWIVGGSLGAA